MPASLRSAAGTSSALGFLLMQMVGTDAAYLPVRYLVGKT